MPVIVCPKFAKYTIFLCPYWEDMREEIRLFPNRRLSHPEDVHDIMCGPLGWK